MSSPDQVQVLDQQNAQRDGAKRATFEAMKAKKPKRLEFKAVLEENAEPVSFLFVAIAPSDFSDLVTAHPPTDQQKEENPQSNVNGKTFPPALLARVCREPKLTEEQWAEIWENDDGSWTTAEKNSLYWEANALCNAPLDLRPFVFG